MIWKQKSIKDLLPAPIKAAHHEYSMILSLDDDPARPTEALIDLSLSAIQKARKTDLSFLKNPYASIWPGEHYKLLAAFMQVLEPELVIEIGTATGLSALAMLPFFKGKLITYDIKPWSSYPNTVLKEKDFGRLEQIVGDLGNSSFFQSQKMSLAKANFIFIDATHDGELETRLLDQLASLPFEKPVYIFFDDIRVWTMLKMWREIPYPKLDLTSFGHWSGSGIVQLDRS